MKAELSQIYENLKVFLSALSFEAGLKVPEWDAPQMTQVCKKPN